MPTIDGERDQDRREHERRAEHEQAVAAARRGAARRSRRPGSALVSHVFPHVGQRPPLAVGDLGRCAAVARDRDQRRAHLRDPSAPPGRATLRARQFHFSALGIVRTTVVGSRATRLRSHRSTALPTEVDVATAVVQEQQLLKTLRWYDGFVIALANPGFLLGSLGYLGRRSRWLGRSDAVGHLRRRRRLHQHDLLRARDDVPREVGRPRALRPRGVAEVHDARRPDRHVRLLDRLVGRPLVNGLFIGSIIAGTWFPGEPGGSYLAADGYFSTGGCRGRPAGADRDRADPLRLAVQRLRRAGRRARSATPPASC